MGLTLITSLVKAQQIINGGLNVWTIETAGTGSYEDPSGPFLNFYDSILAANGFTGTTIVENTVNPFEGTSNAKIGINNIPGVGEVGGLLIHGNFDGSGNITMIQTIPRPTGVSFYYKLNTINNLDTAVFDFVSNNFAEEIEFFTNNQSNWTYHQKNFVYTGTGTDSIALLYGIYNVSQTYSNPAMTFEIDDVKYLYVNGLTEKLAKQKVIDVYPNPTTEFVQFELENATNKSFEIYDANGAKVYVNSSLTSNNVIDLSAFNKGTYFYILIDNSLNEIIDRGNVVKM